MNAEDLTTLLSIHSNAGNLPVSPPQASGHQDTATLSRFSTSFFRQNQSERPVPVAEVRAQGAVNNLNQEPTRKEKGHKMGGDETEYR